MGRRNSPSGKEKPASLAPLEQERSMTITKEKGLAPEKKKSDTENFSLFKQERERAPFGRNSYKELYEMLTLFTKTATHNYNKGNYN